MDLEVALTDVNSNPCPQNKRKRHKQRHNSTGKNHKDHGLCDGSSSMENRILDSDSLHEPEADKSVKLDLEAQLDSDEKKGRNQQKKRRCALKDKALGHDASEGASLEDLPTDKKTADKAYLYLEKSELTAEVSLSNKRTEKRTKSNNRKTNGYHHLHEGGHMSSPDLKIIDHSDKVNASFGPDTSSIKNPGNEADDYAVLIERGTEIDVNERNTKTVTYCRRKTRLSNSPENNFEPLKEDGVDSMQVVHSCSNVVYSFEHSNNDIGSVLSGNKLGRLQVENGTSVHMKDIAVEGAFVNCSDSRPASEKRKNKKKSILKNATDESNFLKMQIIPMDNSEPVNEVMQDKTKFALLEESENLEEGTEVKEINPSSSDLGVMKDDIELGSEEKNPPHTSQSLLKQAVIFHSRKKLLILDLNGILADIVPCFRHHREAIVVSGKSVFKRPYCDEFLQFCFERFNIGVWSSRTKKNLRAVLEFLMGDYRHRLCFCWDQSQCTDTGFTTHDDPQKPLLLKELRKLWEKHDPNLPWVKGEYNESNTMLLDDSPYKALLNPVHTAIFPYSYEYTDSKKDNMLGIGGRLRIYLERLALADNVQKYVRENPFGQRAITKSSATWPFYRRVIRKCSLTRANSSAYQRQS